MPTGKFLPAPGINNDASQTLAMGGWSRSNLVRFRMGMVEKIDGWARLIATACAGMVRGLHAFLDLDSNKYLLLGSANAFEVSDGEALYQVSLPIGVRALAGTGGLSCTSGSFVIAINDANHGLADNDIVSFPTAVSISNPAGTDGLPFYPGETYRVTVVDTDNYIIQRGSAAAFTHNVSSSASYATTGGTAAVTVTFRGHGLDTGAIWKVTRTVVVGGTVVPSGNYSITKVDGNTFTIVAAAAATSSASATEVVAGGSLIQPITSSLDTATSWFIDNFGTRAVFCPENGPLYQWLPPLRQNSPTIPGPLGSSPLGSGPLGSGPVTPDPAGSIQAGSLVENAPAKNGVIFVAMPQAQVVSLRAESAGVQDPLLVRWSGAGQYDVWTATATNQAGSYRLSRGSRIVGGGNAAQGQLVWTDVDVWTMQYTGFSLVYSFRVAGEKCGLIAAKAHVTIAGATFWMSHQNFYQFGAGGVAPVPCTVWDQVFGNLHASAAAKARIYARSVESHNEIVWRYPSADGSGEIDSYVKYNVLSREWDYGSLVRTAGVDQHFFGGPIEIDGDRIIQVHETGYDDDDAAMSGAFIESGYFDLGEGGEMMLLDQIIPDFKWLGSGGYMAITIYTVNYPGETPVKHGPFNVTPQTRFASPRLRARQAAVRVAWGPAAGFSARLGAIRYRVAPDGRRP